MELRSSDKTGACITWVARLSFNGTRAGHDIEENMRPEITRTAEEIEQALALLRRHL